VSSGALSGVVACATDGGTTGTAQRAAPAPRHEACGGRGRPAWRQEAAGAASMGLAGSQMGFDGLFYFLFN